MDFSDEIRASGLFDPAWYVNQYRDVGLSGLDPLTHYARIGVRIARDPGPEFETSFYLQQISSLPEGSLPFLHYLRIGRAKGYLPNPKAKPRNGQFDGPLEIRSGHDNFMLRGLRPTAEIAIVVNAPNVAAWNESLKLLLQFEKRHDLFVLGDLDISRELFSKAVSSVTRVPGSDAVGGASSFLRLASSHALDDYEAVLWLSVDDDRTYSAETVILNSDKFLMTQDIGLFYAADKPLEDFDTSVIQKAINTFLPRLGLQRRRSDLRLPSGQAVWLKPLLLRGLASLVYGGELKALHEQDNGFLGRDTILILLSILAEIGEQDACAADTVSLPPNTDDAQMDLRAVAFYLPQFHPIPENDLWWGKGFTEWTNVNRAKQLFRGHYQPRVPTELGYYDLRLEDTQVAQAELAREFGIHGFCYYYYWFDGKKLLNHPIEQMAKSKNVDAGFCVCWANENWSRNWDGQNRHVLMEQTYSMESNVALIRELIPMMKDPRWIRHNGKPVMMVYRISIIPNWKETAIAWRDECRKAGLGEIHLCAVRFGLETLNGRPEDFGLDAYVLFPPHEATRVDLRDKVLDLHKGFNGEIFDYEAVVDGDLAKFAEGAEWPVHRGAMLGWDNTARRMTDSRIFHGASPYSFRRWMKGILKQELSKSKNKESLVFINAWNEWAEGTYLEPDQRWGRTYLRAFSSAVAATSGVSTTVLPKGVAQQPRGETSIEKLGNPLAVDARIPEARWYQGERKQNSDWPTVMLCAHVSGHLLFGGERSFLDVLEALSSLPVNVVVTLPSDNNKSYVDEISRRSLGAWAFSYPQWVGNRECYGWLTTLFADIIAQHGVDVVHANTIVLLEPLAAAARMGRARVVHARELISLDDPLRERLGGSVSDILNRVYANSDWVIGNSAATTQLFSRPGKTLYVPNAVNLDDFDMRNVFGETISFGIVSSNIPKKGVADFVEVARRAATTAPKARFVVVGPETELLQGFRMEVEQGRRPDNLVFAGYAEHPRKAMSQLHVLMNLSHFAESFGRTVAEAMAARRPVIAYDWGALSELVKSGQTGLLVPYRDIDAAVAAVEAICNDPRLIQSMGEAGRDYVAQHFSLPKLKEAVASSYDKILEGTRGSVRVNIKGNLPAAKSIGCANRTTIIIPIYNAPGEVRDCIVSVLKHTNLTRDRVLLIDDASPDGNVAPMLEEFAQNSAITILRNQQNIGYTKTINRAITEAGEDDVVLLNSDTIVTPHWLEGLRSAAYSREKVGTVTAMSDNAGAFSFPHFNQYCPRPAHMTHEEYALLITQSARNSLPPEVPTGSGFCMFIRRSMLNECGLFDAVGFPRGYGEENDFCMRGLKAGWLNLISPWSFVYHIRTASFKGEKATLVKAGVDVVTKRYPDYSKLVGEAFEAPSMQSLRKVTSVL